MKQLKFAEQKKETKLKNFIQSKLNKTVVAFALKRYYINIDKILIEKFKDHILEKVININLRIILKTHMHIFRQPPFWFQNNQHTMVGVAHTWYPLSSHFGCNNVWKMTKFKF